MNIQFTWDEKYSVDNSIIDEQHKSLFQLGNELPDESSGSNINRVIMRLYKYTREHFTAEEEMMASIGFPLLNEHKRLHDNLITQLNEVCSTPPKTDSAILNFKKFVFDWLIDHIMTQDNKYFVFVQQKK